MKKTIDIIILLLVVFCKNSMQEFYGIKKARSELISMGNIILDYIMSNHTNPPPQWLDAIYIQKMMTVALGKPDFSVKDIEISPGSKVGDNYVGQIFRIKVSHGENGEEKMTVIAKYQPSTKVAMAVRPGHDLFCIEAGFFIEILPQLIELKKFEQYFAPHVHFVDIEKKLIIMEDLQQTGFYMQPRSLFLNKEQAKLTIAALAKLHGSSYYLIQKEPNLKDRQGIVWCETKSQIIYKFADNGQRLINEVVDSYGFSEEWTNKLKGLKDRLLATGWFKICDLRENSLNFILHGDCWKNNMMYHETDGKYDDVRLCDYQVYYYGCFANDLQYFFFSSIICEIVLNDLDELLEFYYIKLKEIAPDIPNLTLDRIKTEFAERYLFGLYMSILFRPFSVSDAHPNAEKALEGGLDDVGFGSELYISNLRKFLEFFDKLGVF